MGGCDADCGGVGGRPPARPRGDRAVSGVDGGGVLCIAGSGRSDDGAQCAGGATGACGRGGPRGSQEAGGSTGTGAVADSGAPSRTTSTPLESTRAGSWRAVVDADRERGILIGEYTIDVGGLSHGTNLDGPHNGPAGEKLSGVRPV